MKQSKVNSEKVEAIMNILVAEGVLTEKERAELNGAKQPGESLNLSIGLARRPRSGPK